MGLVQQSFLGIWQWHQTHPWIGSGWFKKNLLLFHKKFQTRSESTDTIPFIEFLAAMKWKSPKKQLPAGCWKDVVPGTYQWPEVWDLPTTLAVRCVIQGSEPDFSCHLRQELRDVPGQLSVLILTSGHPRMHHETSRTSRNGSSFYQIHPPKWGTNATRKNLKPTNIPQTQNYGLEHWSCWKVQGGEHLLDTFTTYEKKNHFSFRFNLKPKHWL